MCPVVGSALLVAGGIGQAIESRNVGRRREGADESAVAVAGVVAGGGGGAGGNRRALRIQKVQTFY